MNPIPVSPPIPIVRDSEERLAKIRRQLEAVFEELHLVRDVITVSIDAMQAEVSDFGREAAHVLFRCGAEKLYRQLKSLSNVIEQLGGRAEWIRESAQEGSTQEEQSS